MSTADLADLLTDDDMRTIVAAVDIARAIDREAAEQFARRVDRLRAATGHHPDTTPTAAEHDAHCPGRSYRNLAGTTAGVCGHCETTVHLDQETNR